ncbi:MAG: hypothetical protein MSA20_07950 [Bacteroidales bacterium]|nr:hypothetical protein [Bacteroidales bacterium]
MKSSILLDTCFMAFCLAACTTPHITTNTAGTTDNVGKELSSINQYNLIISDKPIEHVIDISTEAGRAKLNGISKKDAQALVYSEALSKSQSATIIDPKYTFTERNGRILGVKIYGFPAKYKNKE